MSGPYQTVVTSIFVSVLAISCMLIYRFIYPKKEFNSLALVIIISLLPLFSLLRPGTYESGSLSDYVKFSFSFYTSLAEGNIIPRWDTYRCAGFGCPQFVYMYILPYYVVSFFHFIGIDFINSLKLLLASTFVFSGIGMYMFIKQLIDEKTALVSSIFYLFAPYHLSDLHFSSDIGEMLAFALIPFIFLLSKKIVDSTNIMWVILFGFAELFFLTSHHVIFFTLQPLIIGFYFLYALKRRKLKNKFIRISAAFVLGAFFSAFYWIPILNESNLINWGKYGTVSFIEPIYLFFFSPWRYGLLFQGPNGELSFAIGYLHLLSIFLAVIFLSKTLLKKKSLNFDISFLLFLILSSLVYFVLMLSFTEPLWHVVPFMKKFQFSYRLLIPIAFSTSIISGIVFSRLNLNLRNLILAIVVFSTILNWGNRRTIPEIDDKYLINELKLREPIFQVTIPSNVNYEQITIDKRPINQLEIEGGKGTIVVSERKSTNRIYNVTAYENLDLKINIFYYPGWTLFLNNDPVSFITKKDTISGVMFVKIPKGEHTLSARFSNTPLRVFGDYVSAISITFAFFVLLKHTSKSLLKRNNANVAGRNR